MTTTRVQCPRCGQDFVHRVRLAREQADAFACPECDALWLNANDIKTWPNTFGKTWFDLDTFLKERGDSYVGRRWPAKGQVQGHGMEDLGVLASQL
jgi:hypothetical protein